MKSFFVKVMPFALLLLAFDAEALVAKLSTTNADGTVTYHLPSPEVQAAWAKQVQAQREALAHPTLAARWSWFKEDVKYSDTILVEMFRAEPEVMVIAILLLFVLLTIWARPLLSLGHLISYVFIRKKRSI